MAVFVGILRLDELVAAKCIENVRTGELGTKLDPMVARPVNSCHESGQRLGCIFGALKHRRQF